MDCKFYLPFGAEIIWISIFRSVLATNLSSVVVVCCGDVPGFLATLNTVDYLLGSSLSSVILFSFSCWQLLLQSCLICINDCSSLCLSLCLGSSKSETTDLIHQSSIGLLRGLGVNYCFSFTTVSSTGVLTSIVFIDAQLIGRDGLDHSWTSSGSLDRESLSLSCNNRTSLLTLNNSCCSTILLDVLVDGWKSCSLSVKLSI